MLHQKFQINVPYDPKYIKGLKDENPTNNLILANDIALSLNTQKHDLNLNTLVIGESGSGKSRSFVFPNLLEANTSFVLHDFKGVLLNDLRKRLSDAGYDIQILSFCSVDSTELRLESITEKKTALFIVTCGGYSVAPIFEQVFDVLSNEKTFKESSVPVRVFMDGLEFTEPPIKNLAQVFAIPTDRISLNLIAQNVEELERLYPKMSETIIDNCDSIVFLGGCGCTNKTLSKFVDGKWETVETSFDCNIQNHEFLIKLFDNKVSHEKLCHLPVSDCIVKIRDTILLCKKAQPKL